MRKWRIVLAVERQRYNNDQRTTDTQIVSVGVIYNHDVIAYRYPH